jgi:N-acetylglucosamine transport system substrate-binding protein
MAPVPVLNASQDHYVMSSEENFWIPKGAKNIPLAKEFLKFLYTEASIKSFAKNANGVFAVKGAPEIARDLLTPVTYNMFTMYNTGKFFLMDWEALPANAKVSYDPYLKNMPLLLDGSMSVNAYIKAMEDAFTELTAGKK